MNEIMIKFILGTEPKLVHEKVVLAPCWHPDSVGIQSANAFDDSNKIWDCSLNGEKFTYIVTGVGAGICLDVVMALSYTDCKKILFIGSAGALKSGINIGDIAFPTEVLCAEGASRYLNQDIKNDVLWKKYYVDISKIDNYINFLANNLTYDSKNIHVGRGVSVESLLTEYNHMEKFVEKKCDFIDMESSAFLATCEQSNINATIVYCISDNVAQGEPLYSVLPEMVDYRKKIRKSVFPYIIEHFLRGD